MDNGAKKDTNLISNALLGMMIFNAVNSAYIVNYRPKTGTYHIWLCSALGVLMVVFSVWVIIMCIRMLKGKKLDGREAMLSRFASNKSQNEVVLRDVVTNFLLAV